LSRSIQGGMDDRSAILREAFDEVPYKKKRLLRRLKLNFLFVRIILIMNKNSEGGGVF